MDRHALHRAGWRTSSHSANGSTCVEVAHSRTGSILVRDTQDRHGPLLTLTPAAWHAFTTSIKASRPPGC